MRFRTRAWAAIAVVGALGVLGACSDVKDSSLCPTYLEYVETVASLEVDALGSPVEAVELVDAWLEETRKLQSVADDRHTDEVDALVVALEDLQRTLAAIDPDDDPSTYEEAITESLADVADAAVAVDDSFGTDCNPEN